MGGVCGRWMRKVLCGRCVWWVGGVFCDRKLIHVFNTISFFIVYIDRTQTCTVLHASTVCFSRPTLYNCVCYLIMISLQSTSPNWDSPNMWSTDTAPFYSNDITSDMSPLPISSGTTDPTSPSEDTTLSATTYMTSLRTKVSGA